MKYQKDISDRVRTISRNEMYSVRNYLSEGLFQLLFFPFKYLSFPFSNYFRFIIIKIFAKRFNSSYINDGVNFYFLSRISVGTNSSFNQGVIIDGTGGVTIGNNVRIAAYTTINTADHEFSNISIQIAKQGYIVGEVLIEDDVWIGTGTVINKAVRIGKGSIIGSGSVVTKDIPPYSVAVGNPCKVIRQR